MADHKTAVNIWLQLYFLSEQQSARMSEMVRHTAVAKHIFTLESLLSVVMLPLFAVQ